VTVWSTPIDILSINDGRHHVTEWNEEDNLRIMPGWSDIIREQPRNVDGSAPGMVVLQTWWTGNLIGQRQSSVSATPLESRAPSA
jgi:hypothetical protein